MPKENRHKCDPSGVVCRLLGYEPNSHDGYRLWIVTDRKVTVSRNVSFNEGDFSPNIDYTAPNMTAIEPLVKVTVDTVEQIPVADIPEVVQQQQAAVEEPEQQDEPVADIPEAVATTGRGRGS